MSSPRASAVRSRPADECFWSLDAPVRRVGAPDVHVPYEPTLESAVLPQVDDIATALTDLLAQ